MKNYLLILMAVLLIRHSGTAQSNRFTIHGKVDLANCPIRGLVLSYEDSIHQRINDTIPLQGDRFFISGSLRQPMYCQLIFLPDTNRLPRNLHKPVRQPLAIGNEAMQLDIRNHLDFTLTGSQVYIDQMKYKERVLKRLAIQPRLGGAEKNQMIDSFILEHPTSAFSMILLKDRVKAARHAEQLPELFAQLPKSVQDSPPGQEIQRLLQDLLAVKEGSMAPDFTLRALDGKLVQISALRGQYVFLDFWASWCIPCRQENPHVVKAFRQLDSSHVVFIGFSLDREDQLEDWKKAIEKDGLVWPQLCDLQGFDSPIAKLYKVKGVPRNFLIDPKGKIIAINLRGEDLGEKILSFMQEPRAD